MLCDCLNPGYLLRLSLVPDLSDLAPISPEYSGVSELFDGRAAVFYRGYGTETTSGRLLPQKLDFLQANLLSSLPFLSPAANRTKASYSRYADSKLNSGDGVAAMAPYIVADPDASEPGTQVSPRAGQGFWEEEEVVQWW